MSECDPIVGNWYKNIGDDSDFCVVALDEQGGTIELQYQDGGIEEMDRDSWYEAELEFIEAPDDWSDVFDDPDQDEIDQQPNSSPDSDVDQTIKRLY